MWSEIQLDPKRCTAGHAGLISLPFNQMKYHSSCGLRRVTVCLLMCIFVFMCEICLREIGVCSVFVVPGRAMVSASAVVRTHRSTGFLFSSRLPAPACWVTWVLWVVSRPIISCG